MENNKDIFYPNKLTKEEIQNLKDWQLKVAVLHFGKQRKDCVDLNYGYEYRYEKWTDYRPDNEISKNKEIIMFDENKPVSLRNEIDWNDTSDLLHETGFNIDTYLKYYLLNHNYFEQNETEDN
jgi:hypothetical protein